MGLLQYRSTNGSGFVSVMIEIPQSKSSMHLSCGAIPPFPSHIPCVCLHTYRLLPLPVDIETCKIDVERRYPDARSTNSTKVLIKMHSQSGIWQAQSTTVQIHRDEALEEYSIPTPQDVFEREDFEYVKEQWFQHALA